MAAFGSVFMPEMSLAEFDGEMWSDAKLVPLDSLSLHPGAHALHYASTCFEGLKAFRHPDGSIKIFRIDCNVARLAQSTDLLALPAIDQDQSRQMIIDVVARFANEVPEVPGSLYIRPTHLGTEPIIGKAAEPSLTSCQYVLGLAGGRLLCRRRRHPVAHFAGRGRHALRPPYGPHQKRR